MMSLSRIHLCFALIALLCAAGLAGCGGNKAATQEELTAFKGDPSKMPADFKAKVAAAQAGSQQAQQTAQQKAAQSAATKK